MVMVFAVKEARNESCMNDLLGWGLAHPFLGICIAHYNLFHIPVL